MELSIEQALQQGVAAHKEGRFQEAERLYRAILKTQPAHPDANHNLGVLAVSANKAKVALPLFKVALEANPKIEQFWVSYIDALIKEKQFEHAERAFEQCKKTGLAGDKLDALGAKLMPEADGILPSQSQLYRLLEYYQNGQHGDAEKLAISITEQFPHHQFSWKVLGAVFGQLGRLDDALIANENAVRINPQDAEAHNNLGNTLKELGRLEETEGSYRQAIALKMDFPEAHNNLGIALKEMGRLDEAEASYRQAIVVKPDFTDAHSNLGVSLTELGRLDEAGASYMQAIAMKPDYAEPHSNLGNTLRELGRLEEAEARYRQAIELKPDYAEAHYNLGSACQELGRLEEAEASYRQAILLRPDYAAVHYNLGSVLQELGRLGEAEASYRQAIVLKSDFTDAHYNLGVALRELGKLEEAEASYRQTIALKPDFAPAKHLLAALTGNTTESAPRIYVEKLFDSFASKFDSIMVDNLEYKIPRVITEMIIENHSSDSLGSVLDLGCGTGLAGVEIKQFCDYLEGIDLSNSMLDQANRKNVYDKLVHRDITEYLATENLDFDYFISTDVFIYLGELSSVFQLIKSRNRSGGKLVFSTEDTNKDGFFLEQSGRYSHSKQYIESLCTKFDYKLCHFENLNLRKEKNRYISGGLYLLDF